MSFPLLFRKLSSRYLSELIKIYIVRLFSPANRIACEGSQLDFNMVLLLIE
jgi:hypothetical protein